MIEIAVKDIERVCDVQRKSGDENRICKGCVIDSRQVQPDSIFVAFSGERVDGNSFAPAAIEAGAFAVIVGTAITHPTSITTWFKAAVEG